VFREPRYVLQKLILFTTSVHTAVYDGEPERNSYYAPEFRYVVDKYIALASLEGDIGLGEFVTEREALVQYLDEVSPS
jgi:hypothetical protein